MPVNLLLLIELAAVVVGATAFLFYWNRLLASVLTFLIRLYTWRVHRVYITVASLQISPLAGRISFRGAEYHSSNLSIRALNGHITWRYWKIRIRQEVDSQSTNPKRNKLPCRIVVYAKGVECFVYNRTPAYDTIVERMRKHEAGTPNEPNGFEKGSGEYENDMGLRARLKNLARMSTKGSSTKDIVSEHESVDRNNLKPTAHQSSTRLKAANNAPENINWFREALPVEVRLVTGSIVLGSDATPTVLIGDFKRAEGTVETSNSRSILDCYKMTINLNFHEANVLTRTNVDYSGPLLAHGKKIYEELLKRQADLATKSPSVISFFSDFHSLAKRFPFLYNSKFSAPPIPGLPTDKLWKGLARYRLPEDPVMKLSQNQTKGNKEYAKVTSLLEAPELSLTYYADTPGLLPDPEIVPFVDGNDKIGNIDLAPEYGINIVVHRGIVKYGPWADRQRDALQRAFTPTLFFHSEPKPRLKPGDTRVHTNLVLKIILEDDTTLRIPTKESSKDWQYDNRPVNAERRYGWLDVVVGPNSSIVYTQEQIATSTGYESMLVLQLNSLAISSSVNLDTFIRAKTCKLSMAMPTPLEWNALRDWSMDVVFDSPSINLLRDHVTLIADLAKDWSSGIVGGDYHHFVPSHYNFKVTFIDYAFHLYINDYNIVDAPGSRDDNAFMDVYGPCLDAVVVVAATQYRPESSMVPFTVTISDARVDICVPRWDTHRAFGPEVFEAGRIGELTASGSYRYYTVPRPDHQETLNLHLEGNNVKYKALGWVLRRMFCIKDNYFGGFTQFTTIHEFLEKYDHNPASVGDPVKEKYRPGKSDPYMVNITMNVENSLIVMSDEIYNCSSGIALPVPQLQMTIKSVEKFMELFLSAAPTYVVAVPNLNTVYFNGHVPLLSSEEAVFIEGIELKANRLFGPQPTATTYLCLWEIKVPKISAFLKPELVSTLQAVGTATVYTFVDHDNAPDQNYQLKTPPDVTFVKLSVDSALAMLTTKSDAVSLEASFGLALDVSTWGTRSYSSNMTVSLPSLSINLLHRPSRKTWHVISTVTMGGTMDVFNAQSEWQQHVSEQQRFLKEQDSETGRVWFMYQGGQKPNSHHSSSLYLPMPMEDSKEDVIVDNSSSLLPLFHELESEISESQFTSENSSGQETERDSHQVHQKRRQVKILATTQEPFASSSSSIGDESDSVSSLTSITESDSCDEPDVYVEMADALAAKLQHFRLIHSRHKHKYQTGPWEEDTQQYPSDSASKRRNIKSGSLIRLMVKTIQVNLGPELIGTAAQLATALCRRNLSYDKRLDSLLARQMSSVEQSKKEKQAIVIDLYAPAANVQIIGTNSATLVGHLGNVKCNVFKYPSQDERQALDAICSVMSTRITALSPSDRPSLLSDIVNVSLGPDNVPLFHLQVSDIEVGWHRNYSSRIHSRVAQAAIHTITPFFDFGCLFIDAWKSANDKADFSYPNTNPDATMLYQVMKSAISSQRGTYLPSFAYVTPYGLHEQDSQLGNRRQTGWWLLARFRDWLRNVSFEEIEGWSLELNSMENYVVNQLLQVDDTIQGTENLVRQQPFFKSAFKPLCSKNTGNKILGTSMDIFIYADDLCVWHYGKLLSSTATASSFIRVTKASVGCVMATVSADNHLISQINLFGVIKSVDFELHDSILALAHRVLHLPHVMSKQHTKNVSEPIIAKQQQAQQVDSTTTNDLAKLVVVNLQLNGVDANIVGGGLRLHSVVRQFQIIYTSSINPRHGSRVQSVTKESIKATCSLVEFMLLQPIDQPAAITQSSDRVVISLKTEGWGVIIDRSKSIKQRVAEIRGTVGLNLIAVDSRPQLRALYDFVQEWKARELPLYATTIEEMKGATKQWTYIAHNEPNATAPMELNVRIASVHLQIRAAKALWLRWDIGKFFASYLEEKNEKTFGLKVAPQTVSACGSRQVLDSESASLNLPSVIVTGNHRYLNIRSHLFASIHIGLFTSVLQPAALDKLLSLHQKLGEDIVELIQEFRKDVIKTKRKLKSLNLSKEPERVPYDSHVDKALYDIRISGDGIRLGLCADDVPSTILFEAQAVRGRATNQYHQGNGLYWRAKIDHFSLSLGHLGNYAASLHDSDSSSRQRTASMTMDVEIEETPATPVSTSQIIIQVSCVRTVMHVEALSELADLLKSWSSDLYILRDHRAAEVAEVKQRTTKVLKKFESAENVEHSDTSWLANRFLTVEIHGVGIVIPLVDGVVIDEGGHSSVPALLFSIRAISFYNRHNEVARFGLEDMALQFIQKFDQNSAEHYSSKFYDAKNCMLLPSAHSEAQMSSSRNSWQISAHCSASDFKLIVSPDVSEGILKLIDLFENGKRKIDKVEFQYREELARHAQDTLAAKYNDSFMPVSARQSQRILIRMSFTFNSGIVELHRELSETERRTMSTETRKGKNWHDSVVLPTVSAWAEYSSPQSKVSVIHQPDDDGFLLFNFAVHESRNLLRPTILPFFVQLFNRMKSRPNHDRMGSDMNHLLDTLNTSPNNSNNSPFHRPVSHSTARIQVRITLRIDKSELRLSCAPDSNAYADLKWQSGGFLASTTIGGGSKATIAGSISGVTASIRHEFAEGKSCIEAGAKDMAFSIDFDHTNSSGLKSLSIILDSQLSGQFQLEQFSAWLTFAAVWLDDASKIGMPSRPTINGVMLNPSSVQSLPAARTAVAVIIRFRTVDFNAKLGVTNAKLQMAPVVLRTFSDGTKTNVILDLGVTEIKASGDISGEIRSDSLIFKTTRWSFRDSSVKDPTVLSMSIDAGLLSASLSLQELSVITFTLDPAIVTLADDWRGFAEDASAQIILSFAVKAGVFRSIVRLLAIPALVSKFYSVLNTIDSQERMASHRSNTYKTIQLRKSTEPSLMAATFLQTVLKTSGASSSSDTVNTAQTMRFDLGGIDIGLFNAPIADDHRGDFYRFIVGKVEADLKRQVTKDNLPKRDLNLLVSSIEWISSDGVRAAKECKKNEPIHSLIENASVFGRKEIASLPLMTMTMGSIQELSPATLVYDFDLVWGAGDLDIAIMPYFFEQFYKTFNTLIKGLDKEQITKVKRRGDGASSHVKVKPLHGDEAKDGDASTDILTVQPVFRRRLEEQRPLPVPRIRLLGEATGEAMAWIPKINSANAQLPVMVHRFVTSPLENGMSLLLRLYEKQLPNKAG
nr:hypothetical protein L203_05068 [Cryptococcus depauperatus CBS 7841]